MTKNLWLLTNELSKKCQGLGESKFGFPRKSSILFLGDGAMTSES